MRRSRWTSTRLLSGSEQAVRTPTINLSLTLTPTTRRQITLRRPSPRQCPLYHRRLRLRPSVAQARRSAHQPATRHSSSSKHPNRVRPRRCPHLPSFPSHSPFRPCLSPPFQLCLSPPPPPLPPRHKLRRASRRSSRCSPRTHIRFRPRIPTVSRRYERLRSLF